MPVDGVLELIDRIYATALLPVEEAAWSELLVELERHFVGARAILFLQDTLTKRVSFVHAPHVEQAALATYSQHYAQVNPWWSAMEKLRAGSIHSGEMLFPEAEMVRSEFYTDWLRPQ